jgi:DNA repair exonuclease SbcCD ATPase subunit
MKPIKLTITAGPYAGTQEIDFREGGRSFFLIHGATGS